MEEHTSPAQPGEEKETETGDIVDFGSAMTRTPHGNVYCMTIIGQIEGHSAAASGAKTTKYEHVLPLLAKLEESAEVDGVLFLLNTVGGDVEAGLAIAELIAGMTKPTVSIVCPPGAHERHGHRRAPDVQLFPAAPGPDRGLRLPTQPHQPGGLHGPHAEKGRHGCGCGQRPLRGGGRGKGDHRRGGRPFRRPCVPLPADPGAKRGGGITKSAPKSGPPGGFARHFKDFSLKCRAFSAIVF